MSLPPPPPRPEASEEPKRPSRRGVRRPNWAAAAPKEADWRQLPSDIVDDEVEAAEEEEEEEGEEKPMADFIEGVGETERLDAAESAKERPPLSEGESDVSREQDFRT